MENNLQVIAEYRLNFVLSFVYTLIPLASFILLWLAAYASKESVIVIGGYKLSDMITYYLLATWVGELNASDKTMWRASGDILTGRLSLFLLRPLDYILYCLFGSLAVTLPYSLVGIGLVAGFAALLNIPLVFPDSFLTLVLTVIAFILSYLLSNVIGFLRAVPAFWLESTTGFNQLLDWFFMLSTGSLIPLIVLPATFQRLSHWLPFQYLVFFPVNVYLGQLSFQETLGGLAIGVVWLIVLSIGLRLLWRYGLQHYSAIGG